MPVFFRENFKYYFLFTLLLALFFWLLFFAYFRGQKQAASKQILSQVKEIKTSLDFFYSDNGRFPSADEFSREDVMLNYLDKYPKFEQNPSSACPTTFLYKRPNEQSFELDFCLPVASGNYLAGWNKVN